MKRPDMILRNKANNPMWNLESREKMRRALTGKKQSEETRNKRSEKLKQFYAASPEAKERLARSGLKHARRVAGTSWRNIRLKVIERDNHRCQNCNEDKKRLVVHHKDWRGKRRGVLVKDWNNNLENLITLCDKCHNSIHRHKATDYKIRLSRMQSM